jgi:hypothetical protein
MHKWFRPFADLRSWTLRRASDRVDRFAPYCLTVQALPLSAVPLAHALVHSVTGIDEGLRRWLDVRLSERARPALGQPASRATVSVWHALQDAQATGLPLAAECDLALLKAVGREEAAIEAMRFLLRIYLTTLQLWLPRAAEAIRTHSAPAIRRAEGVGLDATSTTSRF